MVHCACVVWESAYFSVLGYSTINSFAAKLVLQKHCRNTACSACSAVVRDIVSKPTNSGECSFSSATREEEPFPRCSELGCRSFFKPKRTLSVACCLATTKVPSSMVVSHGGVQSTVTQSSGPNAVMTVSAGMTSTVTRLWLVCLEFR